MKAKTTQLFLLLLVSLKLSSSVQVKNLNIRLNTNESISVDIDSDGTSDYKFTVSYFPDLYQGSYEYFVGIKSINSINSVSSGLVGSYYDGTTQKKAAAAYPTNTNSSSFSSSQLSTGWGSGSDYYSIANNYLYNWFQSPSNVRPYIFVKFLAGDGTFHYGWIEIHADVVSGGGYLDIVNVGWETTHNTHVLAGSTTSLACVLDFSLSTTPINPCNNMPKGKIKSTIISGTAPFQYEWNNGNTTPNLNTAYPGTYVLKVTDAKGCTSTMGTVLTKVTQPTNTASLPFNEGFSSTTFIPTGWKYTPPVTNNKWKRVTGVGAFGTSTSCAVITHHSTNAVNKQQDALETPYVNVSGANNSLALTFDVAYAQRGIKKDSLLIFINTDCSNTWQQVYAKGGSSLKTAPATNASFKPTSSQWRKETINLAAYSSASNVKVRIVSVGNKGNNIYVDNVKLTYTPTAVPVASFTATTYNFCASGTFKPTNTSIGVPTGYTWFMPGATPSTSTAKHPTIKFTAPGTYNVTLIAKNSIGNSTPFTKQVVVGNCKVADENEISGENNEEELVIESETIVENNLEVMAYPNPTNGEITIYTSSPADKIQVVNMLGTVVADITTPTQLHTINLAQQTNGIYFVKVLQSNTVQMIRVVKQ
ncbi:MAG: T9SS type A sorting domain-containing protein [Bacteroidetes bacterium]|nr:T9SS type A sorting domain-containing protein [Bacteroidota bacterium]